MVSSVVKLSQTVIPIVREVAAEVDHEMATEVPLEQLDGTLGYNEEGED